MKKLLKFLIFCLFVVSLVFVTHTENIFYGMYENVKDVVLEMFGQQEEIVEYDPLYNIYYEQLTDSEKRLYSKFITCANEYETSFKPFDSNITEKNIENAYQAVLFDHPELFWLDTTYSYQYYENMGIFEVDITYNETINNIEENRQLFDNTCNQIIQTASVFETEEEKEIYVHDQLTSMIEYDENASLNQTSFSAIVNHKTVCAGYAKAFQYIMDQLSIPCYYVVGQSEGEEHAWNIIYINQTWRNVDLTWDDDLQDPYYFFNKTDEEFSQTHTRDEASALLPTCQ